MQIIRISDIHHPRFGEVWHLYQNSFPLCEQRTLDHQITAFKADRFHLDVYLDGETLVGFIGYWDFDDYLYIEHYAINSDLRGGGWGSRILEALQKTAGKTIILEIDEVVDEISTGGCGFINDSALSSIPTSTRCTVTATSRQNIKTPGWSS